MVTVAVAQFAPCEDKDQNFQVIRQLAQSASRQGASMLTLPEYASYMAPTLDARIVDHAEPVDGPFMDRMAKLAKEVDMCIVIGTNEMVSGERKVHNTLVMFDARGETVGVYRKMQLYDAFGQRESAWILPGEIGKACTMTVESLTFAAQTCYDLRFPEVTRTLVDAGADVVLVPAQWVPGPLKEDHWTTLLRARAIENTVYVAAADQCAPYGAGQSMVVDPMGVLVAGMGERVGVACAHVEKSRVDEVRAKNPSLWARRFDVVPRQRS